MIQVYIGVAIVVGLILFMAWMTQDKQKEWREPENEA